MRDRQGCLRGRLNFASSVRVGLLQAVLLFLRHLILLISPLLAHYRRFRRLFVDRMAVLVLMWRRHHFSSYLLLAFVSSCNGPGVWPRLSLRRHILRLDQNGLLLGNCHSRWWQSRKLLRSGIGIDFGQPFRWSVFHEALEVVVKFAALLHQFSHGVTQLLIELHFLQRLIPLERSYFVFEIVGINY